MRISRRNFRLSCRCSDVRLAGSLGRYLGPGNAQALTPPPIPGQSQNGMHRCAGLKTQGPGEHEYPSFDAPTLR